MGLLGQSKQQPSNRRAPRKRGRGPHGAQMLAAQPHQAAGPGRAGGESSRIRSMRTTRMACACSPH